jgi:tRNA(fMet)-specific endonuclease VapC
MSSLGYLLDTSVVVDLLRRTRPRLDFVSGETVIYLCDIVVGELLHGALRSAQPEAQRLRVLEFIGSYPLIATNLAVAEAYARMKRLLEDTGRRIPDNDLWIAAHAVHYRLTLVSVDRHFERLRSTGELNLLIVDGE